MVRLSLIMRRFLLCAVVLAVLPLCGCSSNDDLEGRITALKAEVSEAIEALSLTDEGPASNTGAQG